MLLNISDRLKARKQAGIGLLELMLAIAIISLLLLMAVRYYKAARQQQQIADTISKVSGIIAAEANWAANQSSTTPYTTTTNLINNNYLNPVATNNPWDNSQITVVAGSNVQITVTNVGTSATAPSVCSNVASAVQASLGGSTGGTTNASCGGTTLTVTYQ